MSAYDPKRGNCPRVFLECFHFGAFFAPLHLCVFAFNSGSWRTDGSEVPPPG